MSKNVNIVRIFVASPSDVKMEREIVFSTIKEVNQILSPFRDKLGIEVEAVGWEHVAPSQGLPNTNISNKYPVEECDIVIGIFWKTFGTPPGTKRADGTKFKSGSEEEIERAFEAARISRSRKPVIMLYRKTDNPEVRTIKDVHQLEKVIKFFDECRPSGKHPALYSEFASHDFRDLIRDHLLQVISDMVIYYETVINPLTFPPEIKENIAEPDYDFAYYTKHIAEPKKALNEVKVIFVGQRIQRPIKVH